MPRYEYKCSECLGVAERVCSVADYSENPVALCSCGSRMRRVFHPPAVHSDKYGDGVFSHALGQFVTSKQDFRAKLREKEIEMSNRLGFEQKYSVVDVRDMQALGVTDEAHEQNRKVMLEQKMVEPKFVSS